MPTGIKVSKKNLPVQLSEPKDLVFDSSKINFSINTNISLVRNHTSSFSKAYITYDHGLDFIPAFNGTVFRGSTGKTYPIPYEEFGIPTPSVWLACYATKKQIVAEINSLTSELVRFDITIFNVALGD